MRSRSSRSSAAAPRGPPADNPLVVGKFRFTSRLITGTGKYATYDLMRDCLAASGCEVTTVAVRRERLIDKEGRRHPRLSRPEAATRSCRTRPAASRAEDAIRHARLARELLDATSATPGATGSSWKCLGDTKTLLPDPVGDAEGHRATGQGGLHGAGATPATTRSWRSGSRKPGAASVMPAGSPIGTGQGILNPNNIRIILEYLKDGDPDYPVIVDAGVGTASDVAVAMELGCDGVLLNTGIAGARIPCAWPGRCDTPAKRGGWRTWPAASAQAVRHRVQSVGRADCAGEMKPSSPSCKSGRAR